jgi:hypothetical protein
VEWGDRKVCRRRELESLVGTLNHACKVVRCGRSFLRRMIDLLHEVPAHPTRPHPIRLNRDFRSDLMWWHTFAASWNGISFLLPLPYIPRLRMASDASGSWGCGAWHGHSWFQVQWDERSAPLPIMVKELLPIVLASSVWGPMWGNHLVVCLCDNQAVVACLRSCTSRVPHVMHMLRTLAFIEARFTFCLAPQYIDTKANHLADDLSRNLLSSFFLKVPQADRRATPLPFHLLDRFRDGLAPSTRRSYDSAMKKFNSFCRRYQVLDPFPVTEQLLCSFAAFMGVEGLAPQTVKSYLAAIRNTQLSLGLPDPREQSSLPVLRRVLAGISRSRIGRGQPSRIRLPVTAALLRNIESVLQRSANSERHVLWTVCCTAFFGFFRLGELLLTKPSEFNPRLYLSWGDMAVDDRQAPRMVKFNLKQSKSDPLGRGADVILGRTGCDLCPVTAVLNYAALWGNQSGPFFITSTGRPLIKQTFVSEIREVLARLGLPDHEYAGHSFRIGAATSAAMAGIEDSTIQLLGRWQSAAFLRYIRTPQEMLAAISATLATQSRGEWTGTRASTSS